MRSGSSGNTWEADAKSHGQMVFDTKSPVYGGQGIVQSEPKGHKQNLLRNLQSRMQQAITNAQDSGISSAQ